MLQGINHGLTSPARLTWWVALIWPDPLCCRSNDVLDGDWPREDVSRIRKPLEIDDGELRLRFGPEMTAHHRPRTRSHDVEPFFDQLSAQQRSRLPLSFEQNDLRRRLSVARHTRELPRRAQRTRRANLCRDCHFSDGLLLRRFQLLSPGDLTKSELPVYRRAGDAARQLRASA